MNSRFLPWIRLWWLWVPATALVVASLGFLIWQIASPHGRQGVLQAELEELRATIVHLEKVNEMAENERTEASGTSEGLQQVYEQIFGKLDERLTAVMRAVGSAARDAGMLPKSFGYSVNEDKNNGSTRFIVSFSVEGSYDQVRRLLSSLQNSPQFLIIDSISFKGENDARSRNLAIRLTVSTFLSHTDPSALNKIISRLQLEATPAPVEAEKQVQEKPKEATQVPEKPKEATQEPVGAEEEAREGAAS